MRLISTTVTRLGAALVLLALLVGVPIATVALVGIDVGSLSGALDSGRLSTDAVVQIGLAVFLLWVLPDQLVPGWRSHWLFTNPLTGGVPASDGAAAAVLHDPWLLGLRVARAAVLVPLVEELFWRGWLPRWLVQGEWQRVPMGTFTRAAFVLSALLFASEHGAYWEVGLACGVAYNAWLAHTRALGDLVLAHAVTNAALAAFVLATGQVAYWG